MPYQNTLNLQGTPMNSQQQGSTVAFNGTSLSVDYSSYLSQHDLVYHAPPLESSQAMPIGDGDMGAMLWSPGKVMLQIQKNDLWDDPPVQTSEQASRFANSWSLLSAGRVGINCSPALIEDMNRFEQRLSPYSGVVSLESDSPHGSCQVTAYAAATAGVLVVHYQDQTLRPTNRRVEVSLWRNANLFAMNETIGILQGMSDRRYALMARVQGPDVKVGMANKGLVYIEIAQCRSCAFTLYITVAVSPKNGDPVSIARSRIQSAISRGHDSLFQEHKQHWANFWQKSFLKLDGGEFDPMASYLENLWYLNLYYLASSSRGSDAPLTNGAIWTSDKDSRSGSAIYSAPALRAAYAPLPTVNHLELIAPYVDTLYKILPERAALTSGQYGLAGAHYPERFNRFGASAPQDSQEISQTPEGLITALQVWEAWRCSPDPFFLRERAYPLLRACTEFAMERRSLSRESSESQRYNPALAIALRALIWTAKDMEIDTEYLPLWESELREIDTGSLVWRLPELTPLGDIQPGETSGSLRSWLQSQSQLNQGWFGSSPSTPMLNTSGELISLLNSLVLREETVPANLASSRSIPPSLFEDGIGGSPPSMLHIFPGLPGSWNAAFTLAAPGGFRISAEAVGGLARYVAIRSLIGGLCRISNPWGEGTMARILYGRQVIEETAGPALCFQTKSNAVYLIERSNQPLDHTVRAKLRGQRNENCKAFGSYMLGLPRQSNESPVSPEKDKRRRV